MLAPSVKEVNAMREIQQLMYDGKRLFCPKHPTEQLVEAKTESKRGTFSMLCQASLGGAFKCMNSAEWPSREDMLRDLENR